MALGPWQVEVFFFFGGATMTNTSNASTVNWVVLKYFLFSHLLGEDSQFD